MKTRKGKLTISRPQRSDGKATVEINLVDASSTCEAVSIIVHVDVFAEALMGMGYQPCEYEFNDSGVIGKTREWKTEKVTVPECSWEPKKFEPIIRKAFEPFEVDGWKGRIEDARNHHKLVGRNKDGSSVHTVLFERYV